MSWALGLKEKLGRNMCMIFVQEEIKSVKDFHFFHNRHFLINKLHYLSEETGLTLFNDRNTSQTA